MIKLLGTLVAFRKAAREEKAARVVEEILMWIFLAIPLCFLLALVAAAKAGAESIALYGMLISGLVMGAIPFFGAEFLENWGQKRFRQIFGEPNFDLAFFLNQGRKQKKYYEDYGYQRKVDKVLGALAREFVLGGRERPFDEIMRAKKKFWDAQNLAGALGFRVFPKAWDYVKKEEGR